MAKRKKKKKREKKAKPKKRVVLRAQKRLVLPRRTVIQPLPPHERRLSELAFEIPPLGTPEAARLQRLMEMDVAFQLELKKLQKRLPHIVRARTKGGSGLQLSKLLRSYFIEYLDRLFKHGPHSFPTSFNVVESFMSFNQQYMFFDLREEREHLLSVDDYFLWYETADMPQDPRILEDIIADGTIYSYEMVTGTGSLRIAGESEQVLAGVSFVRHEYELSCLLLAGEKPPLRSDQDILDSQSMFSEAGRDGVRPHPSLMVQDRYLDGYSGHAKVIVLTRFNLRTGMHDVRYVNLDIGSGFDVLTDDALVFRDPAVKDAEDLRQSVLDRLERYDNLFAALASMIYLPAFFATNANKVQELEVATEFHAMRDEREIRETIKELGESQCPTHRRIRCLAVESDVGDEPSRAIEPPKMTFKSDGYWKAIGPREIGEDKDGQPIVGRTWVSRHEIWSARSPESFMLQRAVTQYNGPDPGVVYVQRSPAHEINVYKIGVTRRSPEMRAAELSSATGVPLPFGVLANWQVGDCARVEREVHRKLASFRINPRREFFCAELSFIARTVDAVIGELA
jgi:Meiotically Up-regulated Gene 113 (MUG113) protein